MNHEDWYEADEPLEMLEALKGSPHLDRLWCYVVLSLRELGAEEDAEFVVRWCAGEVGAREFERRQTILQNNANRGFAGGAFSAGRKPIHVPVGVQRAWAALAALTPSAWDAATGVTRETQHQFRPSQCAWLRCLLPNPAGTGYCAPGWRTSTVMELARGVEADGAFDRLPILADALQDAGCDNPDLLAHCRRDRAHVAGCWAVDAVLERL